MPDPALANLYREAEAAWRQRNYAAVEEICRHMLGIRRKDADALTLLGQVYMETGRFAEADRTLREAVRHHPKLPHLRVGYGRLLVRAGQGAGALVQFEKALKLDPARVDAIAAKAGVFEQRNQHEKARRVLEPHVRGAATPPAVAAPFLRALVRCERHDDAIALGEAVASAARGPSLELRETIFELARAYERTAQHDRAFDAAQCANEMLRVPSDLDRRIELFGEIIETFTPSRMESLPRPSAAPALPVFIVGMMRSGSTLVERILDAHPLGFGAGEIPHVHRIVHELPQVVGSDRPYPRCAERLSREHVDDIAERYVEDMRSFSKIAERVSNKDLGNFAHLGLLRVLFPGAAIIHCRRDPMDTCLSCFMERLAPSQASWSTDLETIGRYYRAYERVMDHWRRTIGVPMLEIEYEEIVSDQEGATRRLIEFCGLPWDDACMRFHETKREERTLSADQVRRPVYTSSVGRAARFGAVLDPLRAVLEGGS